MRRTALPASIAPASRGAGLALAVALAAWAPTARAEMPYPGDVDTALGTPGIVEKMAPPTGCQLCHTSPAGGTTTLTTFGNYLVAEYDFPKVAALEDGPLAQSLAMLKAAQPQLWADMQDGIDPNDDPLLGEVAPPQPQYGCSSGGGRDATSPGWVACLLALFAAAHVRVRRRSTR